MWRYFTLCIHTYMYWLDCTHSDMRFMPSIWWKIIRFISQSATVNYLCQHILCHLWLTYTWIHHSHICLAVFVFNLVHLLGQDVVEQVLVSSRYCLQTAPFSVLTLIIGWQEGHPACKRLRSTKPQKFSSRTGGGEDPRGIWLTQIHLEKQPFRRK